MSDGLGGGADDDRLQPEQRARVRIDQMLEAAGWVLQDVRDLNLFAGQGVAVRELMTEAGPADYALFVDRQVVGVIEAKKVGTTLSGVEWQTVKYQRSVPDAIPSMEIDGRLPFGYESTGDETWFTCRFDPEPTARQVFWVHRPETLADWMADRVQHQRGSLRAGLLNIPTLEPDPGRLRPAQFEAIRNLEVSLRDGRPRALIQMATGSGKTYCAANIAERLIEHGGAQRVLFLVDRANLGRQTLKEFQGFEVPGAGRKFSEIYNVQHLTSNAYDPVASVCIATIQRVYSMLRGEELDESVDERTGFEVEPTRTMEVDYQPKLPIEAFDVVIIDECHRSIYGVWRQVLEYFDAFLVGLTATPGKQTFAFFQQNMVMEYGFPQAVADNVNVDFDVFRISTEVSEQGSEIEAGFLTRFRDRETRRDRFEELDEDLAYEAGDLDRKVQTPDQIRTVLAAFRDNLPAMFPGREVDDRGRLKNIPKTLIFAKDDNHAEEIVRIARTEFGKGNDVIAKITYKASDGAKPEDLLAAFRTAYNPRMAVTVDMIATGTDVKPIEAVLFMRMVRSRSFFEQMKGRGVRTIADDDLRAVTPDAVHKDRFVLVDAVGVTETELMDTVPLERKKGISLDKLLQQVALGSADEDTVSTLASRLARLDGRIAQGERDRLAEVAGVPLQEITEGLVGALDPDRWVQAASLATGALEPEADAVASAKAEAFVAAIQPLAANPELREALVNVQRSFEQVIDEGTKDKVIHAGFSVDATARAKETVESFKAFLDEHQEEITALQVLYSRPYAQRLTYDDIKDLAEAIGRPPHRWTTERVWQAYETLDASKVRGSATSQLTDIVSLVRYTLGLDDELEPYPDKVDERFAAWVLQQQQAGRVFTADQQRWLELIKDHLAASLTVEPRDLVSPPFSQHGGLARARDLFGEDLEPLLEELTEAVAA
jgi:type I restriction enzyme R subunit